ncbi:chitobiase/beta-hexosaminidase C-terminal domain-containing protein [Butyrivibrio sp.]|uniref:chitobiase/beta-hexosaminidase C-terminal domain-containing protein n=1 Tax=Butyrivibrio sp. TaxID=28121 RepID=UPI0025C254CA|nr:chitobiase/beta-hexosaminidase C-terminal domain-containing protein [Butyrivibrio sp.]MBQ9302859.1 chitobiase/beta-hexosaminidase C-terminal domain-containing protein [Butyrivibrio sp.]
MTKTTGSGAASQTGVTDAITDVVYTADSGYYFPTDYSVASVNGIGVTRNSYTQITVSGTPSADAEITLTAPTAKTKPAAPTTAAAVDCTTAANNDGKLTGVTTAMEYKKSDATDWIVGTGSDITGLVPGTYYVRLKATDTTTASDNQELTIAEYTAPTYTVTYKVVNGTWSDDSTTDKTETVQSGSCPASVPTGMKAAEGYTSGSWDKNPADTTITEATTFTYTFTENQKVATPTFSPAAGTYTAAQSVEISCTTDGAEIYYTTDGNDPSASSTKYSSAIAVGETTTIKAIAVKEGMTDSSVASTTYTISEGPEPSEETEVRVEDHLSDDSISDDLKNSDFNTVSRIEDALETALSITTEEEKERSKLVDVKLMISTDGGKHWDEATTENFPAGGIDVVLPYPDGTNGDEYSFSVAHMIGTSANGKTAGEIEKPGTTNTSSGISTHFNGLSPVMITWTKNSSPSKKDDSKSKEKAHTHHYVWETIEATEDSDGELRYKCDICGDIQTRVPITAYYVFNKNTTDKIRKAGQGATVKIETSRFISFHKMVMDALAERPDVTLEISFLDGEYKGDRVIVTIPAGTDALSLLDENGFVGFLYLASKYGYTLDN